MKIGPGFVIAAAFVGPGNVTACTLAGVSYGISLLWVLVVIAF
jgi:Mn2+/Fe2+ NRAMP family transporter